MPRLMLTLATALVLGLSGSAALAGPRDFVIYVTRLGGDPDLAKPYIAKFAAYLEETAGWPKGSVKGSFFTDKAQAEAFVRTAKPGFGLLEPNLYLELLAAEKLEPFSQIQSADLVSKKLHLVVKDPSLSTLEKLKGKKLWTTLAGSPVYLSKVVLGGKVDATTHFALKPIKAVLKGVRAVLKGQADAALLDDDQLAQAKKMQGGAALRVAFSSDPLPPIPLVFFGKNTKPAERKALQRVLSGMCGTPKGAPICKELHMEKIVPLEKKLFTKAEERYDAK